MTTAPGPVYGYGSDTAEILLLGEAPGKTEVIEGSPFMGAAGIELTKMLEQAGMLRSQCYLDNVCKYQPPRNRIEQWFYTKTKIAKEKPPHEVVLGKFVHPYIAQGVRDLESLLTRINPKVIIALGNTALWFCTGEWGITKWRGSNLQSRSINGKVYSVVPTYHPAAVLRQWDWRFIGVHDLRTARRVRDQGLPTPAEEFILRPSFNTVIHWLRELRRTADSLRESKLDIAVDIETRARCISCVGLAWTESKAINIPFLEVKAENKNYWGTVEEELEIVWELRTLLTHPNVRVIGQGFSYDQQYFAKEFLFIPNYKPENFHDTMTAHHIMWAGLPKGLDFQSSLYCSEDHVYWKDEGKEWNPKFHTEEQHWTYNCKDCVRTYKIAMEQRKVYEQLDFPSTPYGDPWLIQHQSHESVLRAMLRGVRINLNEKKRIHNELDNTINRIEEYIAFLAGHPLNPRSPQQLQKFFYNDFRIKPVTVYDSKTGTYRRTCNDDALVTLAKREILLAPVCFAINDVRSMGTFKSVAAKALDVDNRIRCQYTVPGTETYRYSSSTDAFGYGTNLQNVSSGTERDSDGKELDKNDHRYRPNLRKMMIPDEGMAIADHDLEQADARIVAWESNCQSLKEIFNDPTRDLHNENCEIIFGSCSGKSDPNRQKAKAGVHATHYGATPPILAAALGITIREAERFIDRYFGERPEIQHWQERIRGQLQTKRYVENILGFRRFYFDRIESVLKEALAWIPQSTVALAINLGIKQVERTLPWAEFLMQVHDSAVHQFPLDRAKPEDSFESIRKAMTVVLPYEDPLTIPVSGSWSAISWGHCK